MKIQAYIYHKRAEQYRDCQDYFKIDLENNRIAVADGMTQSIYPQWWAKILVNAYLENGKIPASTEELKIYQDIWQKQIQEEIAKRENAGKNPWRLKTHLQRDLGPDLRFVAFLGMMVPGSANALETQVLLKYLKIILSEFYHRKKGTSRISGAFIKMRCLKC